MLPVRELRRYLYSGRSEEPEEQGQDDDASITTEERRVTNQGPDVKSMMFQGGSLKTALAIDNDKAMDNYYNILKVSLRQGGNTTVNLVEGQIQILKHVSEKLREVTKSTRLATAKVHELTDIEFETLKRHVANLEARCITEDLQALQSNINGNFLSLSALDDVSNSNSDSDSGGGGIDFDTALAACGLIAGNRWGDGFFSSDRSRAVIVEHPEGGLLRESRYFFQLPGPLDPP